MKIAEAASDCMGFMDPVRAKFFFAGIYIHKGNSTFLYKFENRYNSLSTNPNSKNQLPPPNFGTVPKLKFLKCLFSFMMHIKININFSITPSSVTPIYRKRIIQDSCYASFLLQKEKIYNISNST